MPAKPTRASIRIGLQQETERSCQTAVQSDRLHLHVDSREHDIKLTLTLRLLRPRLDLELAAVA